MAKHSLAVGLGMIGAAIGLGAFVLSQRKPVNQQPPITLAMGLGYELIAVTDDGSGQVTWKLMRDKTVNVAQGTAPTLQAALNLAQDALHRDVQTGKV